jgi:hypothetical protein
MADWKSRADLEDHFRRHGAEVNARDVAAYARLADETVERGIRFTFVRTGRLRIGYYHRRRGHFAAVDADSGETLSLSKESENYVRCLDGSTYSAR